MKIVFLSLGTNLGNREANIEQAVANISRYIGDIIASSSLYETEPWGFRSEELFLNMVLKAETNLTPSEVLGKIMMIESLLGRVRSVEQYSSRVIDIDILLYDGLIIDQENLKIPHPLMHERRFVLVPLCEIAADIIHPVLKKSISELLDICKDSNEVKKYR